MGRRPCQGLARAGCAALLLAGVPAGADETAFGGHIKYRFGVTDYRPADLAAVHGADPPRDHGLDLRLKGEWRRAGLELVAHYELLALSGDSVATRRRLATAGLLPASPASGLPEDRRRLMNLTRVVSEGEGHAAVHRLDRLSLAILDRGVTVRAGRQALSWGNGLAFHPMDVLNPFSPVAIDKEYKTGDDLLYVQLQPRPEGDLQLVAVPRREEASGRVRGQEGTYAGKYRMKLAGADVDLLVADHYDEPLAAVGFARDAGGAVWRLDAVFSDSQGQGGTWSFVTNLDYSWTLAGRNLYGFVEYFHNGFGVDDRRRYATPPAALAARLARGELFTLARDYAALGLQVELSPLVSVFGDVVWNLNDGSRVYQLRLHHDWRQNTQVSVGLSWPAGERGSEYGGIAVNDEAYSAPGRSAFLRLIHHY